MIGNWFELFDFIIYGYFAARIGHPMFPESDPVTIILSSFATYRSGALCGSDKLLTRRRERRVCIRHAHDGCDPARPHLGPQPS